MAKVFKDETGKITQIEFTADEMANKILKVELADLERWRELVKPQRGKGSEAIYRVKSEAALDLFKKRIAVASTNMTVEAVQNIEKGGFLDAYAALAEDCPEGITAHVWRSYGLIVLIQTRYGKKIGPEELAARAQINDAEGNPDVKLAEKHIRLLLGLGLLAEDDSPEWQGQWRHQGLPSAWVKDKE